MIDQAFSGMRVVEISSRLAGGVAGRVLADLGADVLRIERFTQTPTRQEDMALLEWARVNKRIMDSDAPWSADDLLALLGDGDLLITDLPASVWSEHFTDLHTLIDAQPRLVVLDISAMGSTGPHAHHLAPDLIALARSGYLYCCGLNDREPLRIGVDLVQIVTGINAAGGAMIALHHAVRTGQGQIVEVSDLETMLGSTLTYTTNYSLQGLVRRRSPTRMVAVGSLVPCRDGHVMLSTFRASSDILFVMLDDERMLDERFADVIGRELHQNELYEVMCDALKDRERAEIFRTGQELRLQNAMVQAPLETPSCPQHELRQFFQPLALPDGRSVSAPVLPSVPVTARSATPDRGAVTDRLAWLGDHSQPEPETTPTRRAMEGLKVVELTFAWAGPFLGRTLADHGAQVVKIESSKYPDTAKGADQVDLSYGDNGRWLDRSPPYLIANGDKYHIGLELTEPEGKAVLLDLVRWADVVISNFKPDVLPKLGLDWEVMSAANANLVMISTTGFGLDGPYRDYGAWGWGLECMGGVTFSSGYLNDPHPLTFVPTIPDSFCATAGLTAVMAALEERRRTGKGQRLDLSQYECATFVTLIDVLRAGCSGQNRPRPGNRHAWMAPQGVYPCRGNDAWVAIAVETDVQWHRLCEVIDRQDLGADDALASHEGRYARHEEIDEAVAAWTASHDKHDAMITLQSAGVPAGAVQHAKDLFSDPQIAHLEYFRAAWSRETGLRALPGPWHRHSATPGDLRRGASDFGEDNERVLRHVLGYDEERIATLLASDALTDEQGGLDQPPTPGLPVETQLERGYSLSWDADYKELPAKIAASNQAWRRRNGLPEIRLDGRND